MTSSSVRSPRVPLIPAWVGRMHDSYPQSTAKSLGLLDAHPGMRVLDAGCGLGTDVAVLAELVEPSGQAWGIDENAACIAEAQRLYPHLAPKLVTGDLFALPFADGMFDAVHCARVLMHTGQLDLAWRELQRVTKPEGVIVVTDLDPEFSWCSCINSEIWRRYARYLATLFLREPQVELKLFQTLAGKGFRPQFELSGERIDSQRMREALRSPSPTGPQIAFALEFLDRAVRAGVLTTPQRRHLEAQFREGLSLDTFLLLDVQTHLVVTNEGGLP